MRRTTKFRRMLDNYEQSIVVAPGVHDPYCARIAEKAGFELLYMTGAGTSMSRLGLADVGLITATEIQMNARYIAGAVKAPLFADSDTGYGNAINVMRTVRDYMNIGVAGIHIEDQAWPKRCGHLKGKMVISKEEMVGRVRAAKEVIKEIDPDFVLVARTDARGALGGSMEMALERMKAYADAGADLVFADGLLTKEEVKRMAKGVKAPTLFHPTGLSPRLSIEECQEMGIAVVIYPLASFHAMAVAVWDYVHDLRRRGTQAQLEFEGRVKGHPLGDIRRLLDLAGLGEMEECERQFLTEEVGQRYRATIGL